MDADTSIEQMKNQVKDFCDSRDWAQFHSPKDLAIGISTEANELLALFRFKDDAQVDELLSGKEVAGSKIADELADTLFFVLRFAQMNDIDLSEALTAKLGTNELRYPKELSKGKNCKYDQLEGN